MSRLVLPQSYINIENDELAYIDGGLDIISVGWAATIINTAIGAAVGAIGISGYIAAYGRSQAKLIFTRTVGSKLAAWGCAKLSVYVSLAVDMALGYLDIGTKIAKYIDRYDYAPNNGWLSI
jgi:hypothetical protein